LKSKSTKQHIKKNWRIRRSYSLIGKMLPILIFHSRIFKGTPSQVKHVLSLGNIGSVCAIVIWAHSDSVGKHPDISVHRQEPNTSRMLTSRSNIDFA
jgi:hypothetical protein